MVETIVLNHRYKRFVNTWAKSPLNDMDGEQLGVPKMHAVLHALPAIFFWGAVDNAALALQESDHIPYVKEAVKRTRRHEQTYEEEVLLAASFIDATEDLLSLERRLQSCLRYFIMV